LKHGRDCHTVDRAAMKPAPRTAGPEPQPLPPFLRAQGHDVLVLVKLQPRASRNEILDASGGELRVRVTAPPVDAAANEALRRLMADALGCPRQAVELVRGHTSRHKVLRLHGLRVDRVLAALTGRDAPASA
jgi:hypothetical protein